MESHEFKELSSDEHSSATRYNLSVMKPFVNFAFKAMGLITHALIGIVKLALKPGELKQPHHKKN